MIANALDEATLAHLVVYRASDGSTWVRTIDDWNATVEVNGVQTKRFTPINRSLIHHRRILLAQDGL